MKPLVILLLLMVASHEARAQSSPLIENVFRKFWAARTPLEAEGLVSEMLKTGLSFDEAFRRLRAGRTYVRQETGVSITSYRQNNVGYYYAVNVPANYDP